MACHLVDHIETFYESIKSLIFYEATLKFKIFPDQSKVINFRTSCAESIMNLNSKEWDPKIAKAIKVEEEQQNLLKVRKLPIQKSN